MVKRICNICGFEGSVTVYNFQNRIAILCNHCFDGIQTIGKIKEDTK